MTDAELAILSLIAEQPRHGYEIEQVFEERGMRDWTEVGFSSIYYILKKLEKNGLIAGQTDRQAGRGPARKVYHITPAGEDAWRAAVLDTLSIPRRPSSPLMIGLAYLPDISPDEALAALRGYCDRLAEQREHVQARAEELHPLPYHVEAMFDFSLTMIAAELEWVQKLIGNIEARND